MATTYEPNTKLGKPAIGDLNWGSVTWNGNADTLEALAPLAALNVSLAEIPSASLNVRIAPGSYRQQDGTICSYAGAAIQAIPTATTKVLYLDLTAGGVLTVAAAYPTTARIRLATVVAGASTITTITDDRVTSDACGSYADGINIAFGTTTGTKIGTATGQKLGLYNVTPIVQPAGASQAAAAAQSQTSLTDSTGGSVSTTLAAITAGASYAQGDLTAVKNAIASIAAELALVKTDVVNVKTLEDAIRTALVNLGVIKGSA